MLKWSSANRAFLLSPQSSALICTETLKDTWTIMPTIRQKIISLLMDEEMSAREVSGQMGISEKEVYEHLSHISRSVASQNKKIVVTPASCLACGYVFEDRKRFARPSRCPRCKKSHLRSPLFRIS
jgi:predicted Zn-ribbon and HTH transcriptional regulator